MVTYGKIQCQSACNKLKRPMPYSWDLNIYRGCEHGCRYCYAMYAHDYLGLDNFSEKILVKENIVDLLEIELRKKSWKQEVINLGGVTDSYQPAEATFKIMPEILKLLIKYKTPCIISTKSDLICRDYELIEALSEITYVNVAASITAIDDKISSKIEPGAVSTKRRFEMLKVFGETKASTGLHFMPIIPYLTDTRENVEGLYACAHDSKVDYVLPGTLYLRGKTRGAFFGFIKKEFPHLNGKLQALYVKGGADKAYKNQLYIMINELRERYGLSNSYAKPMKEKMHKPEVEQLSLFDL